MGRSPSAPGHPRRAETVLVVDDEVHVRNVTAEVLVMNGYAVLATEGPSEALRIGERHRGPIDLLLSDVVMPEMSGFGLADRLHAMRSGLRVLYVSGYVDRDAIRYRIQEGGAALLMKPFTPEALAHRVREVLDVPVPAAAFAHRPASCARRTEAGPVAASRHGVTRRQRPDQTTLCSSGKGGRP